jgi:hypothetical protein
MFLLLRLTKFLPTMDNNFWKDFEVKVEESDSVNSNLRKDVRLRRCGK